jgi:hypothetical protein
MFDSAFHALLDCDRLLLRSPRYRTSAPFDRLVRPPSTSKPDASLKPDNVLIIPGQEAETWAQGAWCRIAEGINFGLVGVRRCGAEVRADLGGRHETTQHFAAADSARPAGGARKGLNSARGLSRDQIVL